LRYALARPIVFTASRFCASNSWPRRRTSARLRRAQSIRSVESLGGVGTKTILQDQVREAITVEVSSSYHMPTRRDRGKLDTILKTPVVEDPDHVLPSEARFHNNDYFLKVFAWRCNSLRRLGRRMLRLTISRNARS